MDSQTRSRLKQLITSMDVSSDDNTAHDLEEFTDWVYDIAYRKGWQHGLWKRDPDFSYQTSGLARKIKYKGKKC